MTETQAPAKANGENQTPAKTESKLSKLAPKQFFEAKEIQSRFRELMGQRAPGFITSILQLVSGDVKFQKVQAVSIYNSACVAAILDLPINPSLGFAHIIPYGDKAQFQLGWRGLVQLAMRTGQYENINVVEIHKDQFVSWNKLTEELKLDLTKPDEGEIAGYCSFFRLINGYTKTLYWTREKCLAHGKKYSKTYGLENGQWKVNEEAMCKKTMVKQILNKWGILSIELQKAILVDQAVIKNDDGTEVEYADSVDVTKPDVDEVNSEKEHKRIMKHIAGSKTLEQLQQVEQALTNDEQQEFYSQREKELSGE